MSRAPAADELAAIEARAVELARLAGTEIVTALGRTLAVRYKAADAAAIPFKDPVSEVDHRVESLIRDRLAELFPDHGIVGEEIEGGDAPEHDIVWVVDPVDGTANFVNGFPLFAASVGVLWRGEPVVGALWCSTSHALRPGVYHARRGGRLAFDEAPLEVRRQGEVRRHLAGEPQAIDSADLPWDVRKTGSAAIECAFVAAGLLRVARFAAPNAWDVAGGIVLVQAAGGEVRSWADGSWQPFARFTGPVRPNDPRGWRQPVILGEPAAVALLAERRG